MTRRSVLITLLFLLPAVPQNGRAQLYTYIWQPRSTDVGTADKPDYQLLKALLKLSRPQTYAVVPGDSMDFIIRKRFLVSSQFPHAYQLYKQRLIALNQGTDLSVTLNPGQLVQIPGGPKFSGSELSDLPLAKTVLQAQFAALSQKAYDTYTAATQHLSKFAERTLSAFVTPQAKAAPATAFKLIQARGLVAAIDLGDHPQAQLLQAQPIDLYRTDEESDAAIQAVKAADQNNLFEGTFPMAEGIPASCPMCLKCTDILHLPAGVDVSRARVLVEDTGIDPSIVAQSMIIPQVVDPQKTQSLDPIDQAGDKHGTFVFSQLAAPAASGQDTGKGLIPKSQIVVAKVTRLQPNGSLRYSMADILKGWQAFEARIINDTGAAKTWVVNLSMFGEYTDSMDVTPSPPLSEHLLIVAAAGNHGSSLEPARIAFSRLSGPGNPILIVGALDVNGARAAYSNFDPNMVHLFAQGDCVCGSPNQINGTSQATPVVTTAAAILASARPEMKPLEVMWRLISTADTYPQSATESLGGRINLNRALNHNILVQEDLGNGEIAEHQASLITLPAELTLNLDGQPINLVGNELLRLSRLRTGAQTCFGTMQEYTVTKSEVCVSNATQLNFLENGVQKTVALAQVLNIFIPLAESRNTHVPFPSVSIP